MNSPEQRIDLESFLPDIQKEKEINPIFMVRFGFGPHSIMYSDWAVHLAKDIDSFFLPSDSPQKNIFYMEDALGSQSFINKAKKAYNVYGSWLRAYFWADLSRVWKEHDLVGEERFPSEDKLDQIIAAHIASFRGRYAETYSFLKIVLLSLDGIIERKNIKIGLEIETRKNTQERSSVQDVISFIDENEYPTSSDMMRDFVTRMWNLGRLRDSKIADDLLGLYEKAYRGSVPTKVYVSLGGGHLRAQDLLTKMLHKRPSFDISLMQGLVHPQYQEDINIKGVRFGLVISNAFALLDSGVQVSDQEWQRFYEEVITPPAKE